MNLPIILIINLIKKKLIVSRFGIQFLINDILRNLLIHNRINIVRSNNYHTFQILLRKTIIQHILEVND